MTRIKAQVALVIIAILWGSLLIRDALALIQAYRHDKAHRRSRYGKLHSLLVAQDVYVNAQLGGYFRTTISSELGQLKLQGSTTGTAVANVVDALFELAGDGPEHCINAIEKEDKHWFDAGAALTSFTLWTLNTVLRLAVLTHLVRYPL